MMDDDKKLAAREWLKLNLDNIFIWALNGSRHIRVKLTRFSDDGKDFDTKVPVTLTDWDMREIFTILKRGANRAALEQNLPPVFDGINDMPDPQKEFEKQFFEQKAELMDAARSETDIAKKRDLMIDITKLDQAFKKSVPRKLDLDLVLAVARTLDPHITEERVIEFLEFERERRK